MTTTLSYAKMKPREINYEDIAFLKDWLGQRFSLDDLELLQTVMAIHNDILSTQHVYRCIATFSYLKPKSRSHPLYESVLNCAKLKEKAFSILDVGACFGQESRGLIVDGIAPTSIWVVDLHDMYWQAGLRLFLDDRDPSRLTGLHTSFGDWAKPFNATDEDIASPFVGKFDAVLCQSVLHVLSREQSREMLLRLLHVLCAGGVLLGGAVGSCDPREWARTPDDTAPRWLYSASSLSDELRDVGFRGDISVTEKSQWGDSSEGEDSHKRRLEFAAVK